MSTTLTSCSALQCFLFDAELNSYCPSSDYRFRRLPTISRIEDKYLSSLQRKIKQQQKQYEEHSKMQVCWSEAGRAWSYSNRNYKRYGFFNISFPFHLDSIHNNNNENDNNNTSSLKKYLFSKNISSPTKIIPSLKVYGNLGESGIALNNKFFQSKLFDFHHHFSGTSAVQSSIHPSITLFYNNEKNIDKNIDNNNNISTNSVSFSPYKVELEHRNQDVHVNGSLLFKTSPQFDKEEKLGAGLDFLYRIKNNNNNNNNNGRGNHFLGGNVVLPFSRPDCFSVRNGLSSISYLYVSDHFRQLDVVADDDKENNNKGNINIHNNNNNIDTDNSVSPSYPFLAASSTTLSYRNYRHANNALSATNLPFIMHHDVIRFSSRYQVTFTLLSHMNMFAKEYSQSHNSMYTISTTPRSIPQLGSVSFAMLHEYRLNEAHSLRFRFETTNSGSSQSFLNGGTFFSISDFFRIGNFGDVGITLFSNVKERKNTNNNNSKYTLEFPPRVGVLISMD